MTQFLGTINDRKILYVDIGNDNFKFTPSNPQNWLLFIIENDIHNPMLESFAESCIDNDVMYVCSAGKASSEVDDLFDTLMVLRQIEKRSLPKWFNSDSDVLMTSWHDNFDEGFWFATTTANYEDNIIHSVFVANMTSVDHMDKIKDLISKINDGWLPSD